MLQLTAEAWAVVVAVIALIASGVTAYKSSKIGGRQNDLQERLLALESTREKDRLRESRSAQIGAAIVKSGRDYRLVVVNEGPASARNVKILLDDAPLLEHSLVVRGEDEISKLGPGVRADYILAVSMGSPRIIDAKITWQDDTGELRSWESQLKI